MGRNPTVKSDVEYSSKGRPINNSVQRSNDTSVFYGPSQPQESARTDEQFKAISSDFFESKTNRKNSTSQIPSIAPQPKVKVARAETPSVVVASPSTRGWSPSA